MQNNTWEWVVNSMHSKLTRFSILNGTFYLLHARYIIWIVKNHIGNLCSASRVRFQGKQRYYNWQKNDSPPLSIALCRSFVCALAPALHSVLKNVTEAAIIGHRDTFLVHTFLFFSCSKNIGLLNQPLELSVHQWSCVFGPSQLQGIKMDWLSCHLPNLEA